MTHVPTRVITGAAIDIDLAVAERLAPDGRRVLLVDRNPEVHAVAGRPGRLAQAIVAELEVEKQALARAVCLRGDSGDGDILGNNAGVKSKNDSRPFRMEEIDTRRWRTALQDKLTSPLLLRQERIPSIRSGSTV